MIHDSQQQYLRLGASLYVPATRLDLTELADGQRLGPLRSIIFCIEDAVRCGDVGMALENVQQLLDNLRPSETQRFVRVRNPQTLARLLDMRGIDGVDGFVLPKVTHHNLIEYFDLLSSDSRYWLMPTLESAEAFDTDAMRRLRGALESSGFRERVLALRIGGNDLLNLLHLRRGPRSTIYDTPLRQVIATLATVFTPAGFHLTAPVFEGLSDGATLAREVDQDLEHGLYSKSAVHPEQLRWIESRYAVSREDLEIAESVLDESAPAVFRMHDMMCEPATHRNWAKLVIERGRLFGIRDGREHREPTRAFARVVAP